jgi:pyridoxamine 5'-phosphate oxidase
MKLEDFRREYAQKKLSRDGLNADPIQQLETWLGEAEKHEMIDHSAMSLATVNASGQPSQRIVLLKQLDQKGLVFYTNLNSRKAKDITDNAKVSANFAWLPLERQIKIEGIAEKLTTAESLKYFLSRPKDSQLAAWASPQSQVIDSRQFLLNAFEQIKTKFSTGEIPLPDFWGGYRIKPTLFEFWQGGEARLHDRFEYYQTDHGWGIRRLAP